MHTVTSIPAFNDNYIWLIMHPESNHCVVVDPGTAAPVIEALEDHNFNLAAILVTHHHWDHTGGVADLVQRYGVPVYGPATDNVAHLTYKLSQDQDIRIAAIKLSMQVIDIPGHTLGHIAYYGHNMLFCGDTLFTAGCGRLFEGTAAQMFHSLSKLAALPDNTMVYCGHEYTASNLQFAKAVEPDNKDIAARILETQRLRAEKQPTVPAPLALEKRTNPFLRCHIPSVIHAADNHAGRELGSPTEVLAAIRDWKDRF